MPHGVALFRLWAALRELMDDRGTAMVDPLMAPLWDRAMGLWATKASWLGVHGHVWMGRWLPFIRRWPAQADGRRAKLPRRGEHTRTVGCAGKRALLDRTAHAYASAQVLSLPPGRRADFSCHDARCQGPARPPVGSRPCDDAHGPPGARVEAVGDLADFGQSSACVRETGASEASLEKARDNLGFCLVLTGRWHQGLALLEEGVRQLRSDGTANGKAFLARGLRKQLRAARLSQTRSGTRRS